MTSKKMTFMASAVKDRVFRVGKKSCLSRGAAASGANFTRSCDGQLKAASTFPVSDKTRGGKKQLRFIFCDRKNVGELD